jgi:hypothetical protein
MVANTQFCYEHGMHCLQNLNLERRGEILVSLLAGLEDKGENGDKIST